MRTGARVFEVRDLRLKMVLHVLAVAALFVCAWLFSLYFNPLQGDCGVDREVFRYAGMLIARGGAPYLDVFDHKPPLIYFLNAFVHHWDPMGPWGLETLLLGGGAAALYWLGVRRRWPLPVIYPLYFMALMRTQEFVATTGLTRSFSSLFLVAAAAVALIEPPLAAGLLGVLFGICFFLQQNDAMPLGILLLYFLFKRRSWWRDLAGIAGGGGLVVASLFLWLAHKGAFHAFIEDAFLFNTKLYVDDHVRGLAWLGFFWGRLRHTVNDFGFKNWFTVSAILFAFLPRKGFWGKRDLAFEPLLWLAAGLFAEMIFMNISGVLFGTYFLGLIPWVVLFSGELFGVYNRLAGELLPRRFVYFLLLATLFVLPNPTIGRSLQRALPLQKELARAGYKAPVCGAEIAKYAEEVAGQKGQFYAFNAVQYLALNRHYGIQAPTVWVSLHYWNQLAHERWDTDHRIFQGILDSIAAAKTKYIYFLEEAPGKPPFLEQDLNDRWYRFLHEHYSPLEKGIWRRKS
jgi:hypothetical protein